MNSGVPKVHKNHTARHPQWAIFEDNDIQLLITSPMTVETSDLLRVASPRSPILTSPVVPLMKMLSHLRSRWMMGGVRVWRKWRPLRICRPQLLISRGLMDFSRRMYLLQKQELNHRLILDRSHVLSPKSTSTTQLLKENSCSYNVLDMAANTDSA